MFCFVFSFHKDTPITAKLTRTTVTAIPAMLSFFDKPFCLLTWHAGLGWPGGGWGSTSIEKSGSTTV